MNAPEMHYDFKKKFNKIDSNNNRNLLVPEIDWTLNEAQDLYIKMVAEPRFGKLLGFESSQRAIDDIRTIVTSLEIVPIDNIITLPENYLYYVRGRVEAEKGNCTITDGKLWIRQHDDEFEKSPFDRSSFEWKEINGVFNESGIRLFTDGTFTVTNTEITYIRKPLYIHNAQDFKNGEYNSLRDELLVGTQDCELPENTHSEIVDLAVLLARGEIQSDLQTKLMKLNLINLK